MTQWSFQSEKSIGSRGETPNIWESTETKAERLKINFLLLAIGFKNNFELHHIEDWPAGVVVYI